MTLPGCETLEDAARNANWLHVLALFSLVLMTLGEIGAALYGHRVEQLRERAHAIELATLKGNLERKEAVAAKTDTKKEAVAESGDRDRAQGTGVEPAVYWPTVTRNAASTADENDGASGAKRVDDDEARGTRSRGVKSDALWL